jgi:hypothetical protein
MPDFTGLGKRIEARRKFLGLSPQRIRAMKGPSVVTLRKMEQGEPVHRRLETTHPLESILGWQHGSIEAYLSSGREPVVVREPDYAAELTPEDLANVPTEVLEAALRARKAST